MRSPSSQQLSVAELVVLRDPNVDQAKEALKLTLIDLMARRVLLQHQEEKRGFFRTQKILRFQLAPDAQERVHQSSPARAVLQVLYNANAAQGCDMKDIVEAARRKFGNSLSSFQTKYIVPSLIERGLIERYQAKMLWIFSTIRLRHTAAGEIALQQLNAQLEEARNIPTMLTQNPAHAAALVLSLGGGILLLEELRSHYAQISSAMRQYTASDAYPIVSPYYHDSPAVEPLVDVSGREKELNEDEADHEQDTNFEGALREFWFEFDFSGFEELDSSFDAFDSSFDSFADSGGDSGGDGGGDGGGGDGGGGE
jgi:uncharacterized membrane protein YgcG